MSADEGIRIKLRNILKVLLLFKSKGLLHPPLYFLLKESVLSGSTLLIDTFDHYDLTVLSDSSNLIHLERLFDVLHEHAISIARSHMDALYSEANLLESHQISNKMTLNKTGMSKAADMAEGNNHEKFALDQKEQARDTRGLIYGEIEFESFQKILDTALTGLQGKTGKFTDLGSGTGKACMWTALTTPFRHIFGIEVIEGLHDRAKDLLGAFNKLNPTTTIGSIGNDSSSSSSSTKCKLEFAHGSFLADVYDWSDSDLAFANSTCFPADLMMKLSVKSQLMKPGSRFITFTASLDSPYWRVIYKERMNMSWGMATVFIHERLSEEDVRNKMMQAANGGVSSPDKEDDGIWLIDSA